ncbi:hypothetical protein [Salininema proteolyticum]|uniref:YtxH domain-containing protein n=1 Tax=Salininema proteolyticum TaxID=1607685 RepID=A0ABV8TZU1_9ACTN
MRLGRRQWTAIAGGALAATAAIGGGIYAKRRRDRARSEIEELTAPAAREEIESLERSVDETWEHNPIGV